jgi:hypothetical protein
MQQIGEEVRHLVVWSHTIPPVQWHPGMDTGRFHPLESAAVWIQSEDVLEISYPNLIEETAVEQSDVRGCHQMVADLMMLNFGSLRLLVRHHGSA